MTCTDCRDNGCSFVDGEPTAESGMNPWLARVRGEYLEMPGLALTEAQARRLWGLDATVCRALLDELSRSGFLRQTDEGAYVRSDQAS